MICDIKLWSNGERLATIEQQWVNLNKKKNKNKKRKEKYSQLLWMILK